MTSKDRDMLRGVHPSLAAAIESVLDEMDAERAPMFVVKGVRSQQEQQALYAQGRSAPGRIVTMKNGTTNRSDHQPHNDGYGYAVDCAFVGNQPYDPRHPWEVYGKALESRGLVWGGRWSHPHDSPHAQYQPSPLLKA